MAAMAWVRLVAAHIVTTAAEALVGLLVAHRERLVDSDSAVKQREKRLGPGMGRLAAGGRGGRRQNVGNRRHIVGKFRFYRRFDRKIVLPG
jgi:hypothetical protein